MNITDWILMAVLTGITIHFYFRKKKITISPEKKKEHPVEQAIRNGKQEKTCPVICVVFQPELEDDCGYVSAWKSLLLYRQADAGAIKRKPHIHQIQGCAMGQTEINSCII